MDIQPPCVVSLTWTLSDSQNHAIDACATPQDFYVGADDLLPRVEEALAGQTSGFETTVHLEPEHAFGDYDASLVCFEPRKLFPDALQEGMTFEGMPEGATTANMPRNVFYTVTEIYPDHVVLDGNHPLAGMALRMQLKVHAVRPATDAESAQASVGRSLLRVLEGSSPPLGVWS